MKMNISLMKLTIRLLILMIFFVIIYLITALLYSSKYWPDIHNYINANITIKRIPTLSELNLTILEVDWTTEQYTTVEDYDTATVEGFDFDIDEFTNIQGEFEPKRPKRNAKLETFENDYNELPTKSVVVNYFFDDATIDEGIVWKKIVKDLVDESKLVPKNLGEIEIVNRRNGERLQKMTECCVDDFFKCFSEFTESFFQTNSKIEHVNASVDRLPEDYKQVKDVGVESIEDLTSAIQKELLKRIESAADVVVTDNPKTKIYVKTFSYDFGYIPNFGGFDFDSDVSEKEDVKSTQLESTSTNSDENWEFSTKFGTLSSDEMSNLDLQTETTENTFETSSLRESTTYKFNKTSEINESQLKSNQTPTFIITQKQESTTPIVVKKIEKAQEKKSVIVKLSNNNQKITIKIPEITSENYTTEYKTQNTPKIVNNNKINDSTKPNQSMATISVPEKQFEKDIRENLIEDDESDYGSDDSTDYPQIDYIDLYKDTTNEENIYVSTDKPKMDITDDIVENIEEYSLEIDTGLDNDNFTNICHGNTSDVSNIFPWIATIFIKNDSANQFQYICDGALSSEKLIITAARCFTIFNSSVAPDDVLVFLGKRSLQVMAEGERNVRVAKIILHSNFSEDGLNGQVVNDLALLVLEDEVSFTDEIRPACFGDGDGKTATTAWAPTGELKPVFFEKPSASCDATQGTVCATYGNEVPLCPSYGGIIARRHSTHWYLHGIRTGDVADRGLCFSKDVLYTPLGDHLDWIMEYME